MCAFFFCVQILANFGQNEIPDFESFFYQKKQFHVFRNFNQGQKLHLFYTFPFSVHLFYTPPFS